MSNTIYNNEYSLASGHVVTTSAISGDGSNSPLDLVNTNKVLYENYDFNTNLVTNMTFNGPAIIRREPVQTLKDKRGYVVQMLLWYN